MLSSHLGCVWRHTCRAWGNWAVVWLGAFLSRCQSNAILRRSAIPVPPAKASWSIQRYIRFPCLRLERPELAWVQAQVSLQQKALQAAHNVFYLRCASFQGFHQHNCKSWRWRNFSPGSIWYTAKRQTLFKQNFHGGHDQRHCSPAKS